MQTKERVTDQAATAGFTWGYENGLRDGACEYLVRQLQPAPPPKRNCSVLYVPQGFEAIDQGVIEALRLTVREVYVAEPARMAELACSSVPTGCWC